MVTTVANLAASDSCERTLSDEGSNGLDVGNRENKSHLSSMERWFAEAVTSSYLQDAYPGRTRPSDRPSILLAEPPESG